MIRSPDPKVVFTTSEVHAWTDGAIIAMAVKSGKSILGAFDDDAQYVNSERYYLSKVSAPGSPGYMKSTHPSPCRKLLLQTVIHNLIPALPNITISSVNPGLCTSRLARQFEFTWTIAGILYAAPRYVLSRTSEAGARNVTTAVVNCKDSNEVSLTSPVG